MKMVINYLTQNDFEIISTIEAVKTESQLLTWQQMQKYPVLQKTQLSSGKIIYRPRSEKGKDLIYKVDSILAGLSEKQVNRRKCIVVDKDDMIISNSFVS